MPNNMCISHMQHVHSDLWIKIHKTQKNIIIFSMYTPHILRVCCADDVMVSVSTQAPISCPFGIVKFNGASHNKYYSEKDLNM